MTFAEFDNCHRIGVFAKIVLRDVDLLFESTKYDMLIYLKYIWRKTKMHWTII